MITKDAKIYVAGHNGMVGSSIVRKLKKEGYSNIIIRSSTELDLTNQVATNKFFDSERPEYVFVAAAKVGGILANDIYRAQFIYENLMIQNNIIHNCFLFKVKKVIFLGSSCIYPKLAEQPIKEEYLLCNYLEETNEPYAIAKIAGLKLCENYHRQYGCNFISVMPSNLYGPNDNFHLKNSHVLSGLLRKMHLAKCIEQSDWQAVRNDIDKRPIVNLNKKSSNDEIINILDAHGIKLHDSGVSVVVWGTGQVMREFLYVDDLADGLYHLLCNYNLPTLKDELHADKKVDYFFNIGSGVDISITELALKIKKVTSFHGDLVYDHRMPDGTPRKLLDITRIQKTGWNCKTKIDDGIKRMYDWYLSDI